MPRYASRNIGVYLSLDGTAAATSLPFVKAFSIQGAADQIDVTSGGDTNKSYVLGLGDFKGSIDGFFDSTLTQTTSTLWKAGRDGISRSFYLYTDLTNPTTTPVFYGPGFFDFSLEADVGGAVSFKSNIVAAGNVYMKP